MPAQTTPLVERIVRALRRAGAPRSSADLAREFLGAGVLDERQADAVLAPVLSGHPALHRTGRGWSARPAAREGGDAQPRLRDRFLAVFAPYRSDLAASCPGGAVEGPPAYTVCAGGEGEARRFEAVTGSKPRGPVVCLAVAARRLHGYRGPADPVRIAERLAVPHVESEEPGAFAAVVAATWERIVDQLAVERVETLDDLASLLDDRLEAADFSGKLFGEGELRALADGPGVYAFLEEGGAALYVGQSSALGPRVRSYFSGPPRDEKDKAIRRRGARLDARALESAPDALVAEDRWIRARAPSLNAKERVHGSAIEDGIVVAPRFKDGCRDPRGAVAFAVAGGALRARALLLPGPRRPLAAAERLVASLADTGVAPPSAQRAGALVDRWRRAHPEAPFLREAVDGSPERLVALLVGLARRGGRGAPPPG